MHQMFVRRSILNYGIGAIASVTLPAFISRGRAETTQFKADLKGSNQVPPNETTGIGTVTVTYDSATKTLTWKGSVSGLTGPITGAHIHGPAEAGKNARGLVWLAENDTKAFPFTKPFTSPFEGSATLTDEQANYLIDGMTYINIHTAAHPSGAIRGQLVKAP